MRYMTTPKYHRDRILRVARLEQSGKPNELPLNVNVNEDRVELYAAGYWSVSDTDLLIEAINLATALAARWSARDRALAAVMDRRAANSRWWADAIEGVLRAYRGELATTDVLESVQDRVKSVMAEIRDEGFRARPQRVYPRMRVHFDEIKAALTFEPLWDEIEEFRWVEPDAS